jgi:MYXO-CTERM domain-containing protein
LATAVGNDFAASWSDRLVRFDVDAHAIATSTLPTGFLGPFALLSDGNDVLALGWRNGFEELRVRADGSMEPHAVAAGMPAVHAVAVGEEHLLIRDISGFGGWDVEAQWRNAGGYYEQSRLLSSANNSQIDPRVARALDPAQGSLLVWTDYRDFSAVASHFEADGCPSGSPVQVALGSSVAPRLLAASDAGYFLLYEDQGPRLATLDVDGSVVGTSRPFHVGAAMSNARGGVTVAGDQIYFLEPDGSQHSIQRPADLLLTKAAALGVDESIAVGTIVTSDVPESSCCDVGGCLPTTFRIEFLARTTGAQMRAPIEEVASASRCITDLDLVSDGDGYVVSWIEYGSLTVVPFVGRIAADGTWSGRFVAPIGFAQPVRIGDELWWGTGHSTLTFDALGSFTGITDLHAPLRIVPGDAEPTLIGTVNEALPRTARRLAGHRLDGSECLPADALPPEPSPEVPAGCGCQSRSGDRSLLIALVVLAGLRRRRKASRVVCSRVTLTNVRETRSTS